MMLQVWNRHGPGHRSATLSTVRHDRILKDFYLADGPQAIGITDMTNGLH
jgi:hypothetical protein